MKTPAEIINSFLSSPKSLKNRAAQVKRVVSGLSAEIRAGDKTGLSEKDMEALRLAVGVLNALADRYDVAASLAKKKALEQEKRRILIRKAMQPTFGSLVSSDEKMAIMRWYRPWFFDHIHIAPDSSELNFHFEDAMAALEYELIKDATKNPDAAVAEAWEDFLAARAKASRGAL